MKSAQLKAVRKEEKARRKALSPKARKALLITCAAVLVMAAGMFSVDLLRAKRRNLPPVFCVPAIEYADGSADYYGLFYKVWRDYNPFEDETRYYLGFWLIPKFVKI